MTKELFVDCAAKLREYNNWENELDSVGISLSCSAASALADSMLFALLGGDWRWDDDPVADWGWVGMWTGAAEGQTCFARRGDWVYLPDAEALYDFVCEMRELGWPEKTPKEWLK